MFKNGECIKCGKKLSFVQKMSGKKICDSCVKLEVEAKERELVEVNKRARAQLERHNQEVMENSFNV